ncbi:MAG: hypothetical protein ABI777_13360, partial [Betaproteobacteria bacterium]
MARRAPRSSAAKPTGTSSGKSTTLPKRTRAGKATTPPKRTRAGKATTPPKRTSAGKAPAPPKRNVVPDSVDFRDRPYMPAIAFAPKAMLPAPVTKVRPSLDQQDSSACTGFALATAMHVLIARRDRKFGGAVAPYMIYAMGRRYDEFTGEAPEGGSSLRGVLKGWYKHGVCAARYWTSLPEP